MDAFVWLHFQQILQYDINKLLSRCPYSIIVFDEVDKAPAGLFDALVPFIDFPAGNLDGLEDHKKAVYIFLSNTGSTQIHDITLNSWRKGVYREKLDFLDFDAELSKEVFNSKG